MEKCKSSINYIIFQKDRVNLSASHSVLSNWPIFFRPKALITLTNSFRGAMHRLSIYNYLSKTDYY